MATVQVPGTHGPSTSSPVSWYRTQSKVIVCNMLKNKSQSEPQLQQRVFLLATSTLLQVLLPVQKVQVVPVLHMQVQVPVPEKCT